MNATALPEPLAALRERAVRIPVLAEIAWRWHTEALTGLKRDELQSRLLSALGDEAELDDDTARHAVAELLDGEDVFVAEDDGSLRFADPSLQDRLAADYLLDRVGTEESLRILLSHLHAPGWDGVLRRLVAAAPRHRAEALVEGLLSRPTSPWEERLRRDLRFLCRTLGDGARIGEKLRGKVRSTLLEALADAATLDRPGLILDGAGAVSAGEAWATSLRDDLRSRLVVLLEDPDAAVRHAAVELFARVEVTDPEVRAAVARRLRDEEAAVRRAAGAFLGRGGTDDPETVAVFAALLHDAEWSVRRTAIEFFAQAGAEDEETLAIFTARLYEEDYRVRRAAIELFTQLRVGDPETRAAIGKNTEQAMLIGAVHGYRGLIKELLRRFTQGQLPVFGQVSVL